MDGQVPFRTSALVATGVQDTGDAFFCASLNQTVSFFHQLHFCRVSVSFSVHFRTLVLFCVLPQPSDLSIRSSTNRLLLCRRHVDLRDTLSRLSICGGHKLRYPLPSSCFVCFLSRPTRLRTAVLLFSVGTALGTESSFLALISGKCRVLAQCFGVDQRTKPAVWFAQSQAQCLWEAQSGLNQEARGKGACGTVLWQCLLPSRVAL